MRNGWWQATLGDVSTIRIGRTPPRGDPRYWTDDLARPFCTIADMVEPLVRPSREGVTEAAEAEGRAKRVPAGSLLMSFKLTIGRIGVAAVDLFPNEAIAWIELATPALDQQFLGLWLELADLSQTTGRAAKGETLNSTSLRAIPVSAPSLAEQQRVVDLVRSFDEAIRASQATTRALVTARRATLAGLLAGDHEIPVSYDRFLDRAT